MPPSPWRASGCSTTSTTSCPSGPLCLLQGDFGLHNTLVEGDRVTALVDWEAATIGPPARELAAAWPAATALMDWPDFVAAYRQAGGSPEATDERAVTFYRVFFGLGACMSSRTGGHLFRTGAKRDLLTAHSGLDAHFRAQRNLVRALADAGRWPPGADAQKLRTWTVSSRCSRGRVTMKTCTSPMSSTLCPL